MKVTHVEVNRAPVLTLWAAVVAERMGFDGDEALTLGRGLAGLNAQSKGQSLGIFHPSEHRAQAARERKPGERLLVQLLGRGVPAMRTEEGIRAMANDKPADPASVQRYLEGKFGEHLADVQAAMQALAKAFTPQELAEKGFALYEQFRPQIPAGKKGWGAKGELDLEKIRSLARAG
jgi:hypothetical protein